jgi:DNA-binding CsgD family transcriptional regulator
VLDPTSIPSAADATPRGSLSAREAQVVEMAVLGLTNDEIARRLGVTSHAIKFHLSRSYKKLGVANRTEAAVAYIRAGAGGS